MSKLNVIKEIKSKNSILQNVKAVDQNKFEKDLLSKVDKAYKNHVNEERSSIEKHLTDVSDRIKILSKSVKELNECLVYNLQNNKCSSEEFGKIRNSLQNQIDLKNVELTKLQRIELKYKDQLTSFEISEKFNNILEDAGKSQKVDRKAKVRDSGETSNAGKIEDGNESDDSVGSTGTMIFDPQNEQIEYIEPVIKKRKIVYTVDNSIKMKSQRIRSDKTMDDANYDEFCERIGEYKNQGDRTNDVDLGSGYAISGELWGRLYGYQQTGVRWLLQLYNKGIGGILGDEMGLGKTIQVIAFLDGLRLSQGLTYNSGPSLIVCPATVMRQWMDEFRIWAPLFRVALLHASGSGYDKPERLIHTIVHEPGVLVTTYSSMMLHHELLMRYNWHFIILDEGHKIKNPNAKITVCAKKFQTPHRLLMSGSPIQNNLKELWSLVDFVYPGKLGSMATFIQNFAVPIMKGGYEHASPLQVETAYRCACVIRDTINEYLLRRTKAEVELQLPRKTEQVLFCGLTNHQNVVYKEYLASKQCKRILAGQQVPFPGLVMMRKICNHPDLVTGGPRCVVDHPVLGFGREVGEDNNGHKFGHHSRSGKMVVVRELLQLWYRGKHKVLLFTQGRMMLQILKRFIDQHQYPYLTMDGTTAIGSRHAIVERFNSTPYNESFVFLLTTRVGGLGLNLTGADRVLVFDPDWNPCTDLQARERAWRIGQSRKVIIYRLVISGSVEEKIYHRQVFKQFLTNRILKNPRQRRFFKTQDLRDLFRLDDQGTASDTSIMFRGTKHYKKLSNYFDESRLPVDALNGDNDEEVDNEPLAVADLADLDLPKENDDQSSCASGDDLVTASSLSEMELEQLRKQARKLSRAISKLQQESTADETPPVQHTKVEGKMIANVRASKEYKGVQQDTSDKATNAAEQIVAALVPNKIPSSSLSISYRDVCAAEKVAEKAKKSLLETALANAGVTDRVCHDAVIDDVTPDWTLVQRQTETAAKSGVAWLRSNLLPVDDNRRPSYGHAKNCFLWNRNEEVVYFQNIDSSTKSHFNGNIRNMSSHRSSTHVRYSSPFVLAIINSRSGCYSATGTADKRPIDNVIVNGHVKSLTKNIYLFFTTICRHRRSTSNELIGHFRDQVSASNNLLFKTILNELCTFERLKDSSGGGIWNLRTEFTNK